jgi:hypothetical protein
MRHRAAPSSMLEVAPTSIQKGMRTQHPSVSRSRRDTPSLGAKPEEADLEQSFRFAPKSVIRATTIEPTGSTP